MLFKRGWFCQKILLIKYHFIIDIINLFGYTYCFIKMVFTEERIQIIRNIQETYNLGLHLFGSL